VSQTQESPAYLILGGSSAVATSAARLLVASGGSVTCAGRDRSRPAALDGITEASWVRADATLPEEVEQAAREVLDAHGRLDGMVNCAGSLLLKPAHLTTPDEWRATIETNLGSAFSVVRAAGRVMTDGGSVVLFSSAAARIGLANHEAIAAAKAGVLGLTLSAAATYAPRNLRFNAIAPGLVRSGMTERITGNETALSASAALHALGRIGEPDEVARWVVWLLDPDNSWVTGQVFGVDGGLSTVRSRGR